VFGGATAAGNHQLKFLKDQLSLNVVKRTKREINGIMVYLMDYTHKRYAVLFNPDDKKTWVAVEGQNIDLEKIMLGLKKVR